VTDATKITYKEFEAKWRNRFEEQYQNYIFSVAKAPVITNDYRSQIFIPLDVMQHITSFISTEDKKDAMTKLYEKRQAAKEQAGISL